MAHKFFEDEASAQKIANTIPPNKLSPATVQECLLKSKNTEEAISYLTISPESDQRL
jgi:hypothetical protein